MTKQKWIVTGITIPIIIGIISLGFDAMSASPLWEVYSWVPSAIFIAAGVLLVALIVYLLPLNFILKLRIRSPIYIKNQIGVDNRTIFSNIISQIGDTYVKKKRELIKLPYDNVLWEESYGRTGNLYANGPLCPADSTRLVLYSFDRIRSTEKLEILNAYIGGEKKLHCLTCKKTYTFGENNKKVANSQNEATLIIEGMIKRERESS